MTMPKQKPGKSGQVFSTPANFMRAITRRPDIREFTIDLAADPLNAKAHRWLGPGGEHPDALSFRSWAPRHSARPCAATMGMAQSAIR
jgi:hypothetical protein